MPAIFRKGLLGLLALACKCDGLKSHPSFQIGGFFIVAAEAEDLTLVYINIMIDGWQPLDYLGIQNMELLDVYQIACRLHTGQVDKAGRPYIEHLTRVLLRVQAAGGDLVQQMASLLHDAIEDRKASAEQLLWLGVPAEVVDMVKILSKDERQGYEEYLAVVKCHPRVLLVKLGDVDDNRDPERLAALPEAVAQRLKKKYDGARQFLAAA